MEFRSEARPSPIAGRWYPGDPEVLARQVDDYIRAVKIKQEDLSGKIIGLVVPHAGYIYSGRTAAYGYKAIADQPRKLVVILSPLHQYAPYDFITTAYGAYQTPLGDVPLAKAEMKTLNDVLLAEGLHLDQVAREGEHSLEIQLPFLQRVWQTPFELIPVMVRTYDEGKITAFASALAQALKKQDALIIASSDLSHFQSLEVAQQLDAETLRRIRARDAQQVLAGAKDESAPACGAAGIAVMLETTQKLGADKAQILNYSTSADATGDASSVVGYGAAAVLKAA